jgi:hypothetical protein
MEGFELCQPCRADDFETLNVLINGAKRSKTWSPIALRIVHEDQGETLLKSDSPFLGSHALVFRDSATKVLKSMLADNGELLSATCPDADLSIFNPLNVVDSLDEEASSVRRFSSGKIMDIMQYSFNVKDIEEVDIFKIPNLRVSPTFVSERFVEHWHSAGLAGLDFEMVWSSD